jgi:CheY-like chemotaxis protein
MIVKCPDCKNEIRLRDVPPGERMVKYLCQYCEKIVRIDLALDEVKSSSSSDSFERIEGRKKILVADDTELIRETARRMLQDAGFEVVTAEDGEEALQRIREEHPDLILTDLLMPRMTGFDLLREVKREERLKDTPILVMSGVFKQNVLTFLHQVGVQGFLDKENLKESLVFRVQTILEEAPPVQPAPS